MFINSIRFINYRNLKDKKYDFTNNVVFLTGRNGAGKTNFLDAIYFLSFYKSLKKTKIEFFKKEGENNFFVITEINGNIKASFGYDGKTKKIKVHNLQKNEKIKLKDFISFFYVVSFIPDDIYIIRGEPRNRRIFLNLTLSKINIKYYENLVKYEKLKKIKNFLLKTKKIKNFKIYENDFLKTSEDIINERIKATEELNNNMENIYGEISGKATKIKAEYITNFHKKETLIKKEEYKQKCLFGPHLDDINFYINGKLFKEYASYGEQKTAVIALKLFQKEYFEKKSAKKAVLIMDDIFSELDKERKENLFKKTAAQNQVFITAMEFPDIKRTADCQEIFLC